MGDRDTTGHGTGPDEGDYTEVELPDGDEAGRNLDAPGEYVDNERADGTDARPRADEAGSYTDVQLPSGDESREDVDDPGEYTDRDR